jgi:hypothetical protein
LIVVPAWASHLEADAALSGYQAFRETLGRRHTAMRRSEDRKAPHVQVIRDVGRHLNIGGK